MQVVSKQQRPEQYQSSSLRLMQGVCVQVLFGGWFQVGVLIPKKVCMLRIQARDNKHSLACLQGGESGIHLLDGWAHSIEGYLRFVRHGGE